MKRLLCLLVALTSLIALYAADGFVRTNGKNLIGRDGAPLVLRGANIGNWMVREPYMMEAKEDAGLLLNRQYKYDAMIAEICGEDKVAEFDRLWMDAVFSEADMQFIAAQGFNTLRVPLHYKYFTLPIEKEPVAGQQTWVQEGFNRVDQLCEWAEKYGILLIIDMHACPGGQSDNAISDYDNTKPSLWTSEANRTKLVALWKKIAERYKDKKCIAGYDLINEPAWGLGANSDLLWNTYKNIVFAIRSVDTNHIVILEGNDYANNYTGCPTGIDSNMMLSPHRYWKFNTLGYAENWLETTYNCPVYVGEWGENSNTWTEDNVTLIDKVLKFAGWTMWSFKKDGMNALLNVNTVTSAYKKIIDNWQNGIEPKPTATALWSALMDFVNAHKINNCFVQKDYMDAMFRRPYERECIPYVGTNYKVGDYVYAVHYDMGAVNLAYWDTDDGNYRKTEGGANVDWQHGWRYRNDGVDITAGANSEAHKCGYYIGWTEAGEWMQYTIDNPGEAAKWDLELRYALYSGTSKVRFTVNDRIVTPITTLQATGGYENWVTVNFSNIIIPSGKVRVRLYIEQGGLNINWFRFYNKRAASLDELDVLLPDSDGNMIMNGDGEVQGAWRTRSLGYFHSMDCKWNTTADAPTKGDGTAITLANAKTGQTVGMALYQPIDVIAGHTYKVDAAVNSVSTNNQYWLQVFFLDEEPVEYYDQGLPEENTIGQISSWEISGPNYNGMLSDKAVKGSKSTHTGEVLQWTATKTGKVYVAFKVGALKTPFKLTLDNISVVDISAKDFVSVDGKNLKNCDGTPLVIRATNASNWMVREPYMMNTSGNLNSQHAFDAMVDEVCGAGKAAEFDRIWMDKAFTSDDMKFLADQGFNTLRVPLHYKYFDNSTEGFTRIDRMCRWAERYNMLLILDMHACPGGQSKNAGCDYDSSKQSLWEDAANRTKLVSIWRKIAERYKNKKCIIGYELINAAKWDFTNNNQLLWDTYQSIINAIREVDNNHIVIVGGNGTNYDGLPTPNMDSKMAVSSHRYNMYNTNGWVNTESTIESSHNCPIFISEFGENSNSWMEDNVRLYEESKNFAGWSAWPLKKSALNTMLMVNNVASYDNVIAQWQSGSKPDSTTLWNALLAWADAQQPDKCVVRTDFIDALVRRPYSRECKPYGDFNYKTGDYVFAAHYDMGSIGRAYLDVDDATYQNSGESAVNWQKGGKLRNDGVDIYGGANDDKDCGYYVGDTKDGEWIQYTINNPDEAAKWQLQLRYALNSGTSKVRFTINDRPVTEIETLVSTGGYTKWATATYNDIIVPTGKVRVRIYFEQGGANINWIRLCNKQAATDGELSVLKPDPDGNVLLNGDCELQGAWQTASLGQFHNTKIEWNSSTNMPSKGNGGALRLTNTPGKQSHTAVYQQINAVEGHTYVADMAVRSKAGNANYWVELYVVDKEPVDYADQGLDKKDCIGYFDTWHMSVETFDGMMSEQATEAGAEHAEDPMTWTATKTGPVYFVIKVGTSNTQFEITFDDIILTDYTQYNFVRVNGRKLINCDGSELQLRGTNVGNWMVREPYMMKTSETGNLGSQHEFDAMIAEICGEEKVAEFDRIWMNNVFSEADMQHIAKQGFNVLRVPLHYKYFTLPIEKEPEVGKQTWLDEGFRRVDQIIEWAEKYGMLLVIDMHACPGGQGVGSKICDYDPSKPSLYESEANQTKLIALWKKIAERYKNKRCVAAYDLVNEPAWTFQGDDVPNVPLWRIQKEVIEAIREVDNNHIVIVEGNGYGNDYTGFPEDKMDDKMMISVHLYHRYSTMNWVLNEVAMSEKYDCPIYVGEFGENSNAQVDGCVQLFEGGAEFPAWTHWPMKKVDGINAMCAVPQVSAYNTMINNWQNGIKPNASTMWNNLMAWAEVQKLENCDKVPDFVDALLRRPFERECIPYVGTNYKVGDYIYAAHYDMGPLGKAYWDTDYADFHNSGEAPVSWQHGWKLRCDGVDVTIGATNDAHNCGYYVGWTAAGEWIQYTIDNPGEAAKWDLELRYALYEGSSKVRFTINDRPVTPVTSLAVTGGYETWQTATFSDILVPSGKVRLRIYIEEGGLNINWMRFCNKQGATAKELDILRNATDGNILLNSDCAMQGAWQSAALKLYHQTTVEWGSTTNAPSLSEDGKCIRVTNTGEKVTNVAVYQKINVQAGHVYQFDAAVRSMEGNSEFWVEAYVIEDEPVDYDDKYMDKANSIGYIDTWMADPEIATFDGMLSEKAAAGTAHQDGVLTWKATKTGPVYLAIKMGARENPFEVTLDNITFTDQQRYTPDHLYVYGDVNHYTYSELQSNTSFECFNAGNGKFYTTLSCVTPGGCYFDFSSNASDHSQDRFGPSSDLNLPDQAVTTAEIGANGSAVRRYHLPSEGVYYVEIDFNKSEVTIEKRQTACGTDDTHFPKIMYVLVEGTGYKPDDRSKLLGYNEETGLIEGVVKIDKTGSTNYARVIFTTTPSKDGNTTGWGQPKLDRYAPEPCETDVVVTTQLNNGVAIKPCRSSAEGQWRIEDPSGADVAGYYKISINLSKEIVGDLSAQSVRFERLSNDKVYLYAPSGCAFQKYNGMEFKSLIWGLKYLQLNNEKVGDATKFYVIDNGAIRYVSASNSNVTDVRKNTAASGNAAEVNKEWSYSTVVYDKYDSNNRLGVRATDGISYAPTATKQKPTETSTYSFLHTQPLNVSWPQAGIPNVTRLYVMDENDNQLFFKLEEDKTVNSINLYGLYNPAVKPAYIVVEQLAKFEEGDNSMRQIDIIDVPNTPDSFDFADAFKASGLTTTSTNGSFVYDQTLYPGKYGVNVKWNVDGSSISLPAYYNIYYIDREVHPVGYNEEYMKLCGFEEGIGLYIPALNKFSGPINQLVSGSQDGFAILTQWEYGATTPLRDGKTVKIEYILRPKFIVYDPTTITNEVTIPIIGGSASMSGASIKAGSATEWTDFTTFPSDPTKLGNVSRASGADLRLLVTYDNETPTGVIDVVVDNNAKVYGGKGEIVFEGVTGKVAVLNETGAVRTSIPMATADHFTVPQPAGIYIVVVNNKAIKVIVK